MKLFVPKGEGKENRAKRLQSLNMCLAKLLKLRDGTSRHSGAPVGNEGVHKFSGGLDNSLLHTHTLLRPVFLQSSIHKVIVKSVSLENEKIAARKVNEQGQYGRQSQERYKESGSEGIHRKERGVIL